MIKGERSSEKFQDMQILWDCICIIFMLFTIKRLLQDEYEQAFPLEYFKPVLSLKCADIWNPSSTDDPPLHHLWFTICLVHFLEEKN